LLLLILYLYVSIISSFFLVDVTIYFRFIRGSIVTTSLSITTAIVGYIAVILVIIISTIRKKNLGLGGVRVFFLLGYD
jgi:hypothetical protein